MNTLMLVAVAGALTALITLLWLVVRAFKKHAGWGIAVLLLSPFTATAFGIRYWQDEKKPFLAYISTFVAAMALGLYAFAAWGDGDLRQASQQLMQYVQNQGPASAQTDGLMNVSLASIDNPAPDPEGRQQPEQQQAALAVQDAAVAPAPEKEQYDLSSIAKKSMPKQERFRLVYTPIKVSDAQYYVGSTVKITRKNVPEKEYRLTAASANSLALAQRNSHGSFSFKFRHSDIEKIRVLTKQPY